MALPAIGAAVAAQAFYTAHAEDEDEKSQQPLLQDEWPLLETG